MESRVSANGLPDGGTIREADVYLVMFEKGICAVRILSSFGVKVHRLTMRRRIIVLFRTYG